jgi:sec-independent protein translocase protein TatA
MFDVGGGEIFLIVLAILLLFGPEKLPELMRSIGKGMSHIRNAQTEFQRNLNAMADEIDEVVQKQPSTTQNSLAQSPDNQSPNEQSSPEPVHERSLAPPPSAETPLDLAAEQSGAHDTHHDNSQIQKGNQDQRNSADQATDTDDSAPPPALVIQPAPNAVPRNGGA